MGQAGKKPMRRNSSNRHRLFKRKDLEKSSRSWKAPSVEPVVREKSTMANDPFENLFRQATGLECAYLYQEKLATDGATMPSLLDIPTGLGKTAAAVLAWLWRRRFADETVRMQTPRRLVYCLPMRTLVEQTFGETVRWLDRLGLLAGKATWETTGDGRLPMRSSQLMRYEPDPADERPVGWAREHGDQGTGRIAVHLLMGGEERTDWALWPERDAILIGTQDMLLSRALNRGYAARRARWPMEFGLLNNDCLWVFDEVQLMGPGLVTGLQLEAFRSTDIAGKKYFGTERPCVSWYMSATVSSSLLRSREWRSDDGDKRPADFVFELSPQEKSDESEMLGRRRFAVKQLEYQPSWSLSCDDTAQRIVSRHQEMLRALAGAPVEVPRRTLIICNTVDRAKALYASVSEALETEASTEMVLLHSRFRPPDRARQQDRLNARHDSEGQIVVATQVVEAGVDLSSAILWTEVAPLPSLIQRFGRLNRAGEFGHNGDSKHGWTPVAVLVGIPLPQPPARQTKDELEKHEKEKTRAYLPYDRSKCEAAQTALQNVFDVSPANLETQLRSQLEESMHPPDYSLQRHELLDFFDTDSNLSLGYTDVSPFIRGIDPKTDIYIAWRSWEGDSDGESPPFNFDIGRSEICQVPIWRVIGKNGLSTWRKGFVWQGRQRGWQPAIRDNLLPGATLLLPLEAGGYDDNLGWTGDSNANGVTDLYEPAERPTDEDLLSGLERGWQSIESHTIDVRSCWDSIQNVLNLDCAELVQAIDEAVRWHDYGKAVRRWQAATRLLACKAGLKWPREIAPVGKFSFSESPLLKDLSGAELRYKVWQLKRSFAPKLRHEVASALALRQHHRQNDNEPTLYELLAEYLVMSHHGYVRKTLRDELPPDPSRIRRGPDEVRGIKAGTSAPAFSIDGTELPKTESLSIACRQMGRGADGSESWTQTALRLLDHFGPFRLAYYEALLRAADRRASAEPCTNVTRATPCDSVEAIVGSSTGGDQQ
jgi:CRISPR-associated endonuclease/helicase Cas3